MMQYKKILAVSLAGVMALGSFSMTFAADQEASAGGSGNLEYIAKSDVFDLVFPTVADDATTFDYILDPDGLIAKTNGDRYTGKAFDAGKTVYFLRSTQVDGTVGTAAGKVDYTDSSDEIKVVNKSTQSVNLVVKAKVEAIDGITMKADTTFGTTEPELYLAIKGTDGTNAAVNTAVTTDGIEITKSIPADDNAYEVKWNDSAQQYEKQLTEAAGKADYTGFKSYTFQLTGACNQVADWADLKDKAPKVDLVWSVKDFTVTGPQVTFEEDGKITITGLTDEKNYASSALELNGQSYELDKDRNVQWDMSNWTKENGGTLIFTLNQSWLSFIGENSAKITVRLTDNTTIDVNKQ